MVAFLSSESPFASQQNVDGEHGTSGAEQSESAYLSQFDSNEGDHVRMVKIYRAYRTARKESKQGLKVGLGGYDGQLSFRSGVSGWDSIFDD